MALLERIADLVRDGKLEGISDLRDESDRTGMRVVVELKRNVDPKIVLRDLYKYTPLQQTFGMQLLALVDGQPRMLSLKRMLAALRPPSPGDHPPPLGVRPGARQGARPHSRRAAARAGSFSTR